MTLTKLSKGCDGQFLLRRCLICQWAWALRPLEERAMGRHMVQASPRIPTNASSEAQRLKPARLADVAEVSQAIGDADVIQHRAQRTHRDAHAIRAAETAELPAAFQVWLDL